MQSFAVIESYLDGCKFNEVGPAVVDLGGLAERMDEREAVRRQGGRIKGWNISFPERSG